MQVGDLVRYKNAKFRSYLSGVFIVTFVFPSGNVRLHPWHDDEAHNVKRLEVVCK